MSCSKVNGRSTTITSPNLHKHSAFSDESFKFLRLHILISSCLVYFAKRPKSASNIACDGKQSLFPLGNDADPLQSPVSKPSYLESIPPEIKLAVLRAILDIKTLGSLIKASPDYHAVYAQNREDIYTTLRQLKLRDVNIQPMHWARLFLHGPNSITKCHLLKPAIESSFQQFQQKRPIKLSVDCCLALLTVMYLEPWMAVEETPANGERAEYRCVGEQDRYAKFRARSTFTKFGSYTLSVSGWPFPSSLWGYFPIGCYEEYRPWQFI